MEAGEIPEIQSPRGGKPAGGVKKEVAVSKRGSLIIPKELIEDLGFKVGDQFLARKTKVGISLKLVWAGRFGERFLTARILEGAWSGR